MDDAVRLEDVARALSDFLWIDVRRGRTYFLEHRVSSVEWSTDGEHAVICTARVRGTAAVPYTSYLTFDATSRRLLSSECSCPLGGSCKHCAATLHALEQELRSAGPRGAKSSASPGGLQLPRATQGAAAMAASWLQLLELSNTVDAHRARTDDEGPQQLVFVVSLEGPGVGGVDVAIFRAPVSGSADKRQRVSARGLDWVGDPAVALGDHAIALRLGAETMGSHHLRGHLGARAFADVVATGRSFLERTGQPDLPLTPGGMKAGTLAFEETPDGRQRPTVRVEGVSEVRLLSFLPIFYVDMSSGAAGPVEVPGATTQMVQCWVTGLSVTVEDAPAVAEQLARTKLGVELPPLRVRAVRTIDAAPVLVLRLESHPRQPDGGYPADPPWVRVFFDYGGRRVDPAKPVVEMVEQDEVVRIRRDPRGELHGMRKPYDAGLMTAYGAGPGTECMAVPRLSPFLLAERVDALAAKGVIVEHAPDYAFETVVADRLQVDLTEPLAPSTSAMGEYAVSLGIRVGDELVDALPLVLAALREHTPRADESLMVPLPDGRTVIVPAQRLEPLRRLLLELMEGEGGAGISRVRALSLDPEVVSRSPKSLDKLRAAITAPRRVSVPKTLRATLREYQRDGFVWLMARRRGHLGALLADDMGLGKTVQALALLLAEEREGAPSLVVCPKSVLGNWEAEAARFAPSLRVHVHHGAQRQERIMHLGEADVVLTTYPILARDLALFTSMRFSTAVLDEAQTIKTRGSKYTAAACALRADFRLALSGTPMENHLGELWSILRFTLPELFGASRTFDKVFRRPIEREQDDEARHDLGRRLAPFFLRRRKEAVASELPPKTVVIEHVPLEDAQREVYETVRASMDSRVREALAAKGLARSQIVVLDALLKLRQAVCDPRLLAAKAAKRAGSAKLAALIEKLRQLVDEGRRVLVFSQFVTMLELVKAELRAEEIPFLTLTGQTENRAEVVDAFQRGDAPVFLLSLKAGGTGLNLTAADVVIHYDPWWNPAAEEQATDRAHRIGQDKPVLVYKLVGKDTIEEKIIALQERKKALFSSVLDDGAGVAKALTPADVAFLFAR